MRQRIVVNQHVGVSRGNSQSYIRYVESSRYNPLLDSQENPLANPDILPDNLQITDIQDREDHVRRMQYVLSRLTKQEIKLMKLVSIGMTERELSKIMKLSPSTIHYRINNIRDKSNKMLESFEQMA